ncbi:MAG: radical SAM protein [Acidobacteria bacterium]|nr:radical SAM protein [Acidobacteriota bacterium]MCB9399280.1 radical SAM protein [Acidobacteriota bacterium]
MSERDPRSRLKLTEIFFSLQGEGAHSGLPCTFVRLTGCALRCVYCDTEYAFHGGEWWSFEAIFEQLERYPTRLIQVTGGEPLHQKPVWSFMAEASRRGYKVLLETSGAVALGDLDPAVHVVLDVKTPGSGEAHRHLIENFDQLKPNDEVKFVVCDQADLAWSLSQIREWRLDQRFQVLISPVANFQDKAILADQVLESGLNVRFQVQLHKIIWGDTPGK